MIIQSSTKGNTCVQKIKEHLRYKIKVIDTTKNTTIQYSSWINNEDTADKLFEKTCKEYFG